MIQTIYQKRTDWNNEFDIATTGEETAFTYIGLIHIQRNLSVTTTSKIKFITCDLFSNVF